MLVTEYADLQPTIGARKSAAEIACRFVHGYRQKKQERSGDCRRRRYPICGWNGESDVWMHRRGNRLIRRSALFQSWRCPWNIRDSGSQVRLPDLLGPSEQDQCRGYCLSERFTNLRSEFWRSIQFHHIGTRAECKWERRWQQQCLRPGLC